MDAVGPGLRGLPRATAVMATAPFSAELKKTGKKNASATARELVPVRRHAIRRRSDQVAPPAFCSRANRAAISTCPRPKCSHRRRSASLGTGSPPTLMRPHKAAFAPHRHYRHAPADNEGLRLAAAHKQPVWFRDGHLNTEPPIRRRKNGVLPTTPQGPRGRQIRATISAKPLAPGQDVSIDAGVMPHGQIGKQFRPLCIQ